MGVAARGLVCCETGRFGRQGRVPPSLPAQWTGGRFDPPALPGALVGYHINPWGRWSGDNYVVDLKVLEESHDARCVKARRTGEIIIPPGYFTCPVKSMISGTKEQPASKGDSDKENVPVPANSSSASSSSSSAGPAPQPEAPAESVLCDVDDDCDVNLSQVLGNVYLYTNLFWVDCSADRRRGRLY